MHAVALDHLIGELTADIGLGLIVTLDELYWAPAQFVADTLEPELKAIEQLLTQSSGRARESRDKSDLDRLLCNGRQRQESTQSNRPHPGLHTFPLYLAVTAHRIPGQSQ